MTKKMGKCHICLKEGKLSREHVPPKSCGNVGRGSITYEHIFYNDSKNPKTKKCVVQNGVSFETICKKCNNEFLGGDYDKELEKICSNAITQLKFVRNTIVLKCKINKVCRDVCAKFLAMNTTTEDKGIDGQIRQYVLDNRQKKILGSHLYIRVFPYKDYLFFVRNQIPMGRENYLKITSELSFFPFSFLFTTDSADASKGGFASIEKMDYNFVDLFSFTTENIDDEIEIRLSKNTMIDKFSGKPFLPNFPFDKYGILFSINDCSMEAGAILECDDKK